MYKLKRHNKNQMYTLLFTTLHVKKLSSMLTADGSIAQWIQRRDS